MCFMWNRLQSGFSEPCSVVIKWDIRKKCETAPWAFTELFEINLNYAIKNRCPRGHGQLFISKRLPTAASDGITLIIQSYQGTWHNKPWHSHTSSQQHTGTARPGGGFPPPRDQIQPGQADDSPRTPGAHDVLRLKNLNVSTKWTHPSGRDMSKIIRTG